MACGAISACGRWNAKFGGRGGDHLCFYFGFHVLEKSTWFVFTDLWFLYSRAVAISLQREEYERELIGKVIPLGKISTV